MAETTTRRLSIVQKRLFCIIHHPRFTDDDDFDLAWVFQFRFDAFDNVMDQQDAVRFIQLVRFDHDPDFSASLDGEAVFDAIEGFGDFFELRQALQIVFQRFPAGTRTGSRNGICRRYQDGFDAVRLFITVMGGDAVDDQLGFAIFLGDFRHQSKHGSLPVRGPGLCRYHGSARPVWPGFHRRPVQLP